MASRAFLRRAGTPQQPQDLAAHNCLHYPRPQERPAWTFAPQGRTTARERVTVQVSGSLGANNGETLRDAALAGLGIALTAGFSPSCA